MAPKAKSGRGNARGGCDRGRGRGNKTINDSKGKINQLQKTLDGLVIRKAKPCDDDTDSQERKKVIKAAIKSRPQPKPKGKATANKKGSESLAVTPWNYYEPPPNGTSSSGSTLHLRPDAIGFMVYNFDIIFETL